MIETVANIVGNIVGVCILILGLISIWKGLGMRPPEGNVRYR